MKTLFRNAVLVNADGSRTGDVLVCDEKIEHIDDHIDDPAATVVDCTGLLLFPGAIDAHTHFDLDVANTTTADDFRSGSRAALRGGTTTVIDFACPNKGESLQYGLELWHKKADGRTACDYGFHMTLDDWNDSIRGEIPRMIAQGVTSFKMYLTYPAMMIGDGAVFQALRELKRQGAIAGVHCENAGVIDALIAEQKAAGALSPASHPLCRPDLAEAEAVGRLLKLAALADTPVITVHTTCIAAMREIEAARARGQKVYVETCPQYLLLDDRRYKLPDFEGACYVCAPPLRKQSDQERLWQGIAAGEIQTVNTDHCSFTWAQKEMGRGDFTKIPGGLPGVETRFALMYSYGVAAGRIFKEKLAELLAANNAKLYGLWGRKGAIREGFDADLVLYDPKGTHAVRAETLVTNTDCNPYEGFQLTGSIRQVYLRGSLAVENGHILETDGGKYLPRGLPQLF
ncbi:MAG: dihydropyrimidinase [Oscillospiraceae bacterium]|nr:dihydropyrimidinase [Oscillospiraceae bacterium]